MSGGTSMYPAVPLLLLAIVGLAAGAARGNFPNDGKAFADVKSGQLIDWFPCPGQGNYADPTTCDHYIACTAGRLAYQMPCAAMDAHGNRLWFVRDSGPNEQTSYCDYPENVHCELSGGPDDEPTTEDNGGGPDPVDPTTESNGGGPDPVDPTQAPPSDCKAIVEGSDCDPEDVKCGQCDWCEEKVNFYFRCHQTRSSPFNPFIKTTGKWVRERCSEGWMIDSTKPLASGAVGGQCIPWLELDPEVADRWTADPNCGLVPELCEYGQEAGDACTNQYWFNLDGQPGNQRAERCTGANDIWDVDTENCRPCSDVPKCAGKGSCQTK